MRSLGRCNVSSGSCYSPIAMSTRRPAKHVHPAGHEFRHGTPFHHWSVPIAIRISAETPHAGTRPVAASDSQAFLLHPHRAHGIRHFGF
jgi:hypothetical protein